MTLPAKRRITSVHDWDGDGDSVEVYDDENDAAGGNESTDVEEDNNELQAVSPPPKKRPAKAPTAAKKAAPTNPGSARGNNNAATSPPPMTEKQLAKAFKGLFGCVHGDIVQSRRERCFEGITCIYKMLNTPESIAARKASLASPSNIIRENVTISAGPVSPGLAKVLDEYRTSSDGSHEDDEAINDFVCQLNTWLLNAEVFQIEFSEGYKELFLVFQDVDDADEDD